MDLRLPKRLLVAMPLIAAGTFAVLQETKFPIDHETAPTLTSMPGLIPSNGMTKNALSQSIKGLSPSNGMAKNALNGDIEGLEAISL